MKFKSFLKVSTLLLCVGALGACSTNPATGDRQFTAFMSPAQENTVGAQEHEKIVRQYGLYDNREVQDYVTRIGRKVTADTERPDVQYKFYVIDSPIVNAFALPGGYIYISRGLLALANSEAELAAVLGHEAGHITARHSAERYSHGTVTSLGAGILGAVIGDSGVSQALNLGSNLYLSSYSRSQENQSDTLGIRYLAKTGYDPRGMKWFLQNLQNHSALQSKVAGKPTGPAISYFSTHPATADRVAKTQQEAMAFGANGIVNRDQFLRVIDDISFGDSTEQGFVRSGAFYHPPLAFAFDIAKGYRVNNKPSEVIQSGKSGAAIIFDMKKNAGRHDAMTYMRQVWMKGKSNLKDPQNITINGMRAATASLDGRVNGKAMEIRIVAIEFEPERIARFQIAIPPGTSNSEIASLKSAAYSFRRLSKSEARAIKPPRIEIVAAAPGDSVAKFAQRMAVDELKEEHFRVYNALGPNEEVRAGEVYKLVVN